MVWNSPFDHPSYKPKPRPKKKAKPKAKPKPEKKPAPSRRKVRRKAKPVYAKMEEPRADGSCLRSPCRPWDDAGWFMDPKVGTAAVLDAMNEVRHGSPKLRRRAVLVTTGHKTVTTPSGKKKKVPIQEVDYPAYRGPLEAHLPGNGKWPLSVACGLGVDSVAILVGLVQLYRKTRKKHWVPKSITFADTGGEQHSTYELLPKLNRWLKKNGFPPIQVIAYSSANKIAGSRSWGTGVTLEIDCLNKQTLPSISFHGDNNSCSLKFKVEGQESWLREQVELGNLRVPQGGRLIRAIGYDSSEDDRMIGGGTYASDGERASGFQAWYPLIEWDWDRSRCIAEIIHEFTGSYAVTKKTAKVVPRKSSCFFCGAMKPFEIAALPKDLLKRALFMEQVAIQGRHGIGKKGKGSMRGLGGGLNWGDFAQGKISPRAYVQQAVIYGTVYKQVRKRATGELVWEVDHYGAPKPSFNPDRQYHQPGTGPLISKAEFEKVARDAKAWVKAAKGLKKPGTDIVCLPAAKKLPAYTKILGFRGSPVIEYDRLRDVIIPALEERADMEHRAGTKAERERQLVEDQAECLRELVRRSKKARARRNPRRLPVVPQNILLLGGQDD
jgi:hypothetical protein